MSVINCTLSDAPQSDKLTALMPQGNYKVQDSKLSIRCPEDDLHEILSCISLNLKIKNIEITSTPIEEIIEEVYESEKAEQ